MTGAAGLADNPRLRVFKDIHAGQRCFIVGNGPSLSRLDLRRLRGEILFGSNRGYLAYALGLPVINYYCLSDVHVYNAHREEILAAKVGARFYRDTAVPEGDEGWRVPYLPGCYMYEGEFRSDITEGTARGHSVTLDLCVPIAHYMGFTEVYLIGCDYSWTARSIHFYECAMDAKTRIDQLPVARMFESFRVAREAFEGGERRLINATAGGNLDELDRVAFDSLF